MSVVRRSSKVRLRPAPGVLAAPGLLAAASLLGLPGATPLAAQRPAEPEVVVAEAAPRLAPPALRFAPPAPPPPRVDPAFRVDRASTADDYNLVGVGVLAAAAGTLGGAFVGYHIDDKVFNWGCEHGCEDPGIYGLVGGWFFGSALTTPLAVHLVDGRRGSLPHAYLSSGLIAGVGMALLAVGSPRGAYVGLGAPVAQVISAVLIERKTTR